ncbi:hypothetical protein M2351_008270 [Azospirillum canadense]|nr:hypothetical protein [Azospirillum canadense]
MFAAHELLIVTAVWLGASVGWLALVPPAH